MRNLFSITDLSKSEIISLIERALFFKKNKFNNSGKRTDLYVSNLFLENSTRTKLSFEVAEKKLGLNVINFESNTSSIQKGETLYDTCKTLESIGINLLVIRDSKEKYYDELSNLNIPVINGGDGKGEHPTQSLVDLMTIYEHFNKFKDLKIAIIGDIKNSRVAKSNFKSLTLLGAKVFFVAPDIFKDNEFNNYYEFDSIIKEIDVCMLLRVQYERHDLIDKSLKFISEYNKNFGLNEKRYNLMKPTSIIMHPAPINRGIEIDSELVEASRSKIFEQMTNGVFIREAVLEFIIQQNNL